MGQSSTWPHYQYTHCRWHEQRSIQSHVVTSITLHKQPRARIQLLNQALGRSCKRGRMDESRKRKYIFVFCTGNLWEGIWGEQEVRGAILKVKEICSALFPFQRQSQQDCTGISKWLQIPALTAPAAAPVSGISISISISPAAEGPSQARLDLNFLLNADYIHPSLGPFSYWYPEVELLPRPFSSLSCTPWLHQSQMLTR